MMKKRPDVPAILFLIVILAVIAACERESVESPSPADANVQNRKPEVLVPVKGNDESHQSDRLFEEMGITQIPPTPIPIDISLPDVDGMMVKFSDFKGKIVFLNFWATWCPPCRFEMPSMEKLHKKLKDRDFVMIAVDLQEPASVVKKFFKDYKLSFISLLDSEGEVAGLFGVRSIPSTFILDREGRIIGGAMGAREWDSKESVALFEHLMNEKAIPSS